MYQNTYIAYRYIGASLREKSNTQVVSLLNMKYIKYRDFIMSEMKSFIILTLSVTKSTTVQRE